MLIKKKTESNILKCLIQRYAQFSQRRSWEYNCSLTIFCVFFLSARSSFLFSISRHWTWKNSELFSKYWGFLRFRRILSPLHRKALSNLNKFRAFDFKRIFNESYFDFRKILNLKIKSGDTIPQYGILDSKNFGFPFIRGTGENFYKWTYSSII